MSAVNLRFANKEDIQKIIEIRMENAEEDYTPNKQLKVMSAEDYSLDVITLLAQKSAFKGLYVILKDDKVIGFFYLYFSIHKNGYTHMRMGIKKEYKKEYGVEILNKIVAYCFYEINYNKINLELISVDKTYYNMLKSNSFDLEGVHREHYYTEGKYLDVYRFGVIKEDFLHEITYEFQRPDITAAKQPMAAEAEYNIGPGENLLTGKKIDLTLKKEADAKILYEQNLVSDEKNFSSLGAPAPMGLGYYTKLVNQYNDLLSFKGDISFAIRKKDGEIAGIIELNEVDIKNRSFMIGLTIIDKENRGKGYGSEAIRLLLDFAFFEMNMHRVHLGCFTFNEGAEKVYERIGFKREGINRAFVYRNGKYYDEVTLGVLRNEWIKIKEGKK